MRFPGTLAALLVGATIGACSSFSAATQDDTMDGGPAAEAGVSGDAGVGSTSEAGANSEAGSDDGDSGLSYFQTVINDAPLVYWRTLDTKAMTMHDETGGGNYLSFIGNATTEDGPLQGPGDVGDTAPTFDGTTNYGAAHLPDKLPAASSSTPKLTIECWIKVATTTVVGGPVAGHVVVSAYSADGPHVELLENATSGLLVSDVQLEPNGPPNDVSFTPPALTAWTHFATVFDGTNVTMYLNGIQQEQSSQSSGKLDWSGTRTFRVGVSAKDGYDFWLGAIDEIAIYDKALSVGQLLSHVNAAQAH